LIEKIRIVEIKGDKMADGHNAIVWLMISNSTVTPAVVAALGFALTSGDRTVSTRPDDNETIKESDANRNVAWSKEPCGKQLRHDSKGRVNLNRYNECLGQPSRAEMKADIRRLGKKGMKRQDEQPGVKSRIMALANR
jgi:hypothetical protein